MKRRRRYPSRAEALWERYGITVAQYEAMAKKQKNLCAICLEPESVKRKGRVRRLAVDHNAETGEVRGLLCGRCNLAIGALEHDVDLLKRSVAYLTNPPARKIL